VANCSIKTGYASGVNLNSSNLTLVGKSNTGQRIYQVPVSSPLFQDYYKLNFPTTSVPYTHTTTQLSPNQYQNEHGIFVVKNSLNQYVVYQLASVEAGSAC
jgi:hypothetical protein